MSSEKKESSLSTTRIEMFSDGVIAIIITLMVLEIKPPKIADDATSEEVRHILSEMLPEIIAYTMSFITLGIFWVNHHQFFFKITHSDRTLIWLNMLLLFWLSLIPLPTAFLGHHPTMPMASFFYGFVMMMCGASFTLMGYYSQHKSGLFTDRIPLHVRKRNMRRNIFSMTLYALSMVTCFYSVYISFALFIIVSAMNFLPKLGFSDEKKEEPLGVKQVVVAKQEIDGSEPVIIEMKPEIDEPQQKIEIIKNEVDLKDKESKSEHTHHKKK